MARLTDPATVRTRIAALLLPPPESAVRVGAFTLRPAQVRARRAMLDALDALGGVLVVDPPGTGKTVLALAVAAHVGASTIGGGADAAPALVIAPAALRSQWLDAAARAGVPVRFASLESLSRRTMPARASLVIVDEAHHARTPGTRRHARLAECCLGARVVLLTATPVVNRIADRDALLALFLGARGAALSARDIARCVIRVGGERAPDARECARAGRGRAPRIGERPAVRRLGAIGRGADVPGLAQALAALPPPLPLADGAAATSLVAMTLAMAWRSSLAALDAALRRRLQRGAVMRDLLGAGHAPTRTVLRHWVVDDGATQLAMEALLIGEAPASTATSRDEAIRTLDRHLDAVRALRTAVRPHLADDAARRAAAIRDLAAAHPGRRVVVFARHAQTVRALHAALRGEPGVVAIVGTRVLAAAGRWARDDVLRRVGPRAGVLRDDDARAIRILLATDVVAEGVEMQGMGAVVHADVPWTPARLEQREGRVTRVGGAYAEVLVARLAAPRGARALIRLGAHLHRKADARTASLAEARGSARIGTVLARWRDEGARAGAESSDPMSARVDEARMTPCAAVVRAPHEAVLAVVGDPPRWLALVRRGSRWRIAESPTVLARLVRAASEPPVNGHEVGAGAACAAAATRVAAAEARVRRALTLLAARQLGSLADPSTLSALASRSTPTSIARRQSRVRARLARLLARAPALVRPSLAAAHAAQLDRLARPMELARERRIDALLRAKVDDAAFARRLGALLARSPGGPAVRTDEGGGREARDRDESSNAMSRPGPPGRLHALLVLSRGRPRRGCCARPAASPGSAAPRRSARARPPSRPGSPGAA